MTKGNPSPALGQGREPTDRQIAKEKNMDYTTDHLPEHCRRVVRISEDRCRETGVVWSWVDEARYCTMHRHLNGT